MPAVTLARCFKKLRKQNRRENWLNCNWSPLNFEEVADLVDREDNELGESDNEDLLEYRKHGRPYLIASGMEEGSNQVYLHYVTHNG